MEFTSHEIFIVFKKMKEIINFYDRKVVREQNIKECKWSIVKDIGML